MNKYEKPMVLLNEELAEGVYAASGSDCLNIVVDFSQSETNNMPEGQCRYTVSFRKQEHSSKEHRTSGQKVVLVFSSPVTINYNPQGWTGDGTNKLTLNNGFASQNEREGSLQLQNSLKVDGPVGLQVSGYAECSH